MAKLVGPFSRRNLLGGAALGGAGLASLRATGSWAAFQEDEPELIINWTGTPSLNSVFPGPSLRSMPELKATITLEDRSILYGIADGSRVYLATTTLNSAGQGWALQAFDAASGSLLWSVPITEVSGTSFAVIDRTLYFVDGSMTPASSVVALDAETGAELWRYTPVMDNWRLGTLSSPIITDGRWIYVAYLRERWADDGSIESAAQTSIHVISARTGRLRRTLPDILDPEEPSLGGVETFGYAEGRFFTLATETEAASSSDPVRLIVMDDVTGEESWRIEGLLSLARVAGDYLFVYERIDDHWSGNAYDYASGDPIETWSPIPNGSIIAAVGDLVIVRKHRSHIEARRIDGSEVWRVELAYNSTNISVMDDVIVVAAITTDDPEAPHSLLAAHDLTTGESLWQIDLEAPVESSVLRFFGAAGVLLVQTSRLNAAGQDLGQCRVFAA